MASFLPFCDMKAGFSPFQLFVKPWFYEELGFGPTKWSDQHTRNDKNDPGQMIRVRDDAPLFAFSEGDFVSSLSGMEKTP